LGRVQVYERNDVIENRRKYIKLKHTVCSENQGVQIRVLRNITQCRLVHSYRRFGVACCLYLHGPRNPRLYGRWCKELKEKCQLV